MTDSGLSILKRKLSAFRYDGRQAFYDMLDLESAKVASRGFTRPTGALLYKKVELSAERIRIISKKGLDVINELAERQVIKIDGLSKQSIVETVMAEVLNEADMLKKYEDNWLKNSPPGSNLPSIITDSAVKAKNEIEIELDILINSKKKNEVNSVFNVYNYGSANTIQTGHNNIINQTITDKSEDLVSAITELLQQLKLQDADSLPLGLTKSIEETLVELRRPDNEKNMFKIQSCLMMTMTTLQTLPALKPAVISLVTAYDFYFGTNVTAMIM